jgi:hypothetical protein
LKVENADGHAVRAPPDVIPREGVESLAEQVLILSDEVGDPERGS